MFDIKEYQKEYNQRPYVKERKKEYAQRPEVKERVKERKKEYQKEYNQRPEVKERAKERKKEYNQRPEVKEYLKEYRQRPEVKERKKEYQKEYDQRPEVKERKKEYNQRPDVKERQKEYAQRPDVKERQKEYTQRPEVKERRKKYRESIPGRLSDAKSRSRIYNLEFNLTEEYLKSIYPEDGMCPLLNIQLNWDSDAKHPSKPSLDRIDNNKGYIKGNVQWVSWRANNLMKDASPEELLMLAQNYKKVYDDALVAQQDRATDF